ncbi:MAG: hypothetical protein JWM98_3180 [Thermoleophilia bacterium]|nr:hypothetical protein [Thermoleophilia bacterium]
MTKQRDQAARERADQKITQHLYEVHALELMVVNTLTAHIAMTPAGAYRSGLETHLAESLDHADRIQRHLASRDARRSLAQVGYGLAQGAMSQAVAFGKVPFDMARGTSGEEMLVKNLRDECANETAEVAAYLILEQYAREVGDTATERLAASIRADEERMLERLFDQAPRLVADAVAADVDGNPQFSVGRVGAIDGVRSVATAAARSVARRTNRLARRVEVSSGSSTPSNRPKVTGPRAESALTRKDTASKGGTRKSTSGRGGSSSAKRASTSRTKRSSAK